MTPRSRDEAAALGRRRSPGSVSGLQGATATARLLELADLSRELEDLPRRIRQVLGVLGPALLGLADRDLNPISSDAPMSPDAREDRCDDRVEDDADGQVDCEDTDCRRRPDRAEPERGSEPEREDEPATPEPSQLPQREISDCDELREPWLRCAERSCAHGRDEDSDGCVDCEDSDCAGMHPRCR